MPKIGYIYERDIAIKKTPTIIGERSQYEQTLLFFMPPLSVVPLRCRE